MTPGGAVWVVQLLLVLVGYLRVRSSTQTGSLYCKSKPKVGGRIKDPMCEAFRHCRVISDSD